MTHVEDIIKRRKSIEQENQRKQDEYQEKIESGKTSGNNGDKKN